MNTHKQRGTTTKGKTMYEVNANNNRSYNSTSAADVADVAVTWKRLGYEPHAYTITEIDDMVSSSRVAITTKKATAKALVATADTHS